MSVRDEAIKRKEREAVWLAHQVRKIKGRRDTVSPEDIVEAARPKGSPLHDRFTWDDTEAAHAWRIEQAKKILRVAVTVIEHKQESVTVRAFVSLPSDRGPERPYRTMESVLSDKSMRGEILARAQAEMDSWIRRYGQLSEAAEIMKRALAAIRRRKRAS